MVNNEKLIKSDDAQYIKRPTAAAERISSRPLTQRGGRRIEYASGIAFFHQL